MASKKQDETHQNVLVEGIERALVWQVDKLKDELGMNRSDAIAYLLWFALQRRGDGVTKAQARAEYDVWVAHPERRP